MNRLFLFVICIITWVGWSTNALEPEVVPMITVTVEGIGTTDEEALKNAFKEAVYQAVGVYMISETKMKDDDISDKIYLNADAIVASHEVIVRRRNNDGSWYIKINAAVVKNDLAARIKKYSTNKVSQTGVISTINKQEALNQAMTSLDLIFQNFPANIIVAEAIGEPEVDAEKVVKSDFIALKQKLNISINYRAYLQFARKLDSLLTPFATQKKRGVHSENFANKLSDSYSDIGKNLLCIFTRSQSGKRPVDWKDLTYTTYTIPPILVKKLLKYHYNFSIFLIFKDEYGNILFTRNFDKEEQDKKDSIPLWERYHLAISKSYLAFGQKNVYGGNNWYMADYQKRYALSPFLTTTGHSFESFTYMATFSIEKEKFMKTRRVDVVVKSGFEADYVAACQEQDERGDDNHFPIRRVAYNNYLPAIEKLGELNDQCEDWWNVAAFMGSKRAQEIKQWTNNGFGCLIGKFEKYFQQIWIPIVTDDGNPLLPKGTILKAVNGKEISGTNYSSGAKELFSIGTLPPNTPVEVELANGQKIIVRTVPREE